MQRLRLGRSLIAALALFGMTVASPAFADSHGNHNGDFMVRVLGTVVDPDASADVFAPPGVPFPGADADVSTEVIPALTLTYFFNPNIAVELFCCFAKHQADGEGSLAPFGEIADFWIFPPALTLQYHFTGLGAFKPYVGAGVQYIAFFSEDTNTTQSVDIDNAFGFTLQAGFDYGLGGGWYLNGDVKKTWLDTDVTWRNGGTAAITADLDVDPWIFSAGLGYRFNLADVFGGH